MKPVRFRESYRSLFRRGYGLISTYIYDRYIATSKPRLGCVVSCFVVYTCLIPVLGARGGCLGRRWPRGTFSRGGEATGLRWNRKGYVRRMRVRVLARAALLLTAQYTLGKTIYRLTYLRFFHAAARCCDGYKHRAHTAVCTAAFLAVWRKKRHQVPVIA